MGKLTAIETYAAFETLWEESKISDTSLTFILDTGLLYTHGFFLNSVSYGTEASGYIPIKVGGVTKNISLLGHTHSGYYSNSADIDISSNRIVSGLSDLLKFDSGNIIIGNSGNPTYLYGTLTTTRNNNNYTILDTGNFSITLTTSNNLALSNVATFKYGNRSFLLDYVKRVEVISTFDLQNSYTNFGTISEASKWYGFMTMYTDSNTTNPKYALIRIGITNNKLEYRTSSHTTWTGVLEGGSYVNFPINGTNYQVVTKATTLPNIWAPSALGNARLILSVSNDGQSLAWRDITNLTASNKGIKVVNDVITLELNSDTLNTAEIGGKFYAVELDKNGKLAVNVPWVSTTTINSKVDDGYVLKGQNHPNKVWMTNDLGEPDWRDLDITNTLTAATVDSLGLVKVYDVVNVPFTAEPTNTPVNGRYYGVQIDGGNKLFVNVPWIWNAFTAATSSAAGTAGYIQAPAGALDKFFRGDNTWLTIEQNVTSSVYFGASNGIINAEIATTPYLIFKEGSSYTRYKLEGAGGITISSDASGNLKFTGTTYSVFTGASSSAAGSTGLVKLPSAGDLIKFLRGDSTWLTINLNVTSALYVGASNGTSTSAQSTNGNVYLIFAEGSSYSRYKVSGSGRASVTSDTNGNITINSSGYSNFGSATTSAAGSAGLVPAPGANILGTGGYFLRADGSWAIPTNTNTWRDIYVGGSSKVGTGTSTHSINFVAGSNVTITYEAAGTESGLSGNASYFNIKIASTNTWTAWKGATSSAAGTAGYMPAPTAAQYHLFLRGDGTWVSLNNYSLPTASNSTLGGVKTGTAITDTTGYTTVAIKDGIIYYKNTTYSFYNLLFQNSEGTTVDTYKPTTSPTKTLKAGSNVTISAASNVITIASKNTWNANAVGVAGYVAAPTKAANANMTWLTDAEGVPAWRASNNHSHNYLPLSGAIYNTSSDTNPFTISRNTTTTLAMLVMVNDSRTLFKYTNDEAASSIVFQLINTDTESEGTAASDHNVTISSSSTGISLYVGGTKVSLNGHTHNYLPLSGGTLTGTLTVKANGTNTYNQGIRINRTATDKWALLLIGKSGDDTSGTGTSTKGDGAWLIGTPASSNSLIFNLNGSSESKGLCLKGHGTNDIKWNDNTVYHAGNLPAYPTKASWDYDDKYVSSLTTSGNYLRWVKDGSNNDITIPYATNASNSDILNIHSLTTEADIIGSGIRGYSSSGSSWTGSLSSMAYAGILTFGSPSIGWQMWARRAPDKGMYWRRGNSNASDWESPRLFLDSENYTSYTVTKDGTGASGTWEINISGNANTAKRITIYTGTDASGGYDLNTLLTGGGITCLYSSSNRWANGPTGMSYGGVILLNPLSSNSLALLFAWDVVHNKTDAGNLWFRTARTVSGNTGWGVWSKILTDLNAKTVLAMDGATDSTNGTAGVVPAPPKDGYNTKFLRADGTWAVPTDTNTDTKVTTTVTEPTSAKAWYPIFTTSASTVTGTTVSNPTGFSIRVLQGTAETEGYLYLWLGNTTAAGTAGNKNGGIYLCNNKGKYFGLWAHKNGTRNRDSIYLPDASGTLVAHTTDTLIGSSKLPVYISASGVATAIGYTIEADVPSGAKFTDTTYSAGTLDLYNTGTNATNCVWSAKVLKSIGDQYLPLAGGTMSNTNLVTNLNADLLDGLHASDLCRKYSYTLEYGKTVKITFSTYYQTIVTGRGSKSTGNSIILVGTGYSTASNYWRALYKGSTVSWCTQSDARGIEIKNTHTAGNLYITVLALYGTVTFAKADDLSGTAVTDVVAMLSSNVASATKLQTARTIWGQSFDGTANISGNMTGVGNITLTDEARIHLPDAASNILYIGNASNNGWVMLADTCSQSGSSYWRIVASGLANFKQVGINMGASNPSYPLHVSGNVGATNFYTTSDRSKKQNISSFSEHIRKFQLKDTEKWHYGVIALEVPEMFRDGEEGSMTVNYNSVLSYYVGILENKINQLELRIKYLENK